jgi:hypothetical protein
MTGSTRTTFPIYTARYSNRTIAASGLTPILVGAKPNRYDS